jgi:predicted TIM-barrel fold metal-dependent hydrolase
LIYINDATEWWWDICGEPTISTMRIVTLEEHVTFPHLVDRIQDSILRSHSAESLLAVLTMSEKLSDITGERLASMDASGITMQVLSVGGPGAELLSPTEGPMFAKAYNDAIAAQIAPYPERFAAFAHLPMTNPHEAAKELARTATELGFKGALVNGMTDGDFLDHPRFEPLLACAERLGLPIYLHPGPPPKAVADAYYSGLPKSAGMQLSISGWGWHSETAIHVLRLIISGTLDRYSGLRIIIGHMGEMLPMMMARCDQKFRIDDAGANRRSISQTLKDQVCITTSGIFTIPPLMAAIDTFGIDNVLFSVDYPFSSNSEGRRFLDSIPLPEAQIAKLAYDNADRLILRRSVI